MDISRCAKNFLALGLSSLMLSACGTVDRETYKKLAAPCAHCQDCDTRLSIEFSNCDWLQTTQNGEFATVVTTISNPNKASQAYEKTDTLQNLPYDGAAGHLFYSSTEKNDYNSVITLTFPHKKIIIDSFTNVPQSVGAGINHTSFDGCILDSCRVNGRWVKYNTNTRMLHVNGKQL